MSLDRFFYHPNRCDYGSPADLGLTFETVVIPSTGGVRLHGWFFPARPPVAGTILHLHGNAGNVSGHFQHVAWLPADHWSVLCFDYRGYGRSTGRVTRAGTLEDARAALDFLLARGDVDPDRVAVFGQSLGGAVGIVLAAERQEVRGIIADGAFDSYRRIAGHHILRNPLLLALAWWAPWFIGRDFDPIDHVARIAPRRILIMHGTADEIVPVSMARRLHAAAGEPRELWLVEHANHYEAMQERFDKARPRLLAFLQRCIADPHGRPPGADVAAAGLHRRAGDAAGACSGKRASSPGRQSR